MSSTDDLVAEGDRLRALTEWLRDIVQDSAANVNDKRKIAEAADIIADLRARCAAAEALLPGEFVDGAVDWRVDTDFVSVPIGEWDALNEALAELDALRARCAAAERQLQRIEHYMGYAKHATGESLYEKVANLVSLESALRDENDALRARCAAAEAAVQMADDYLAIGRRPNRRPVQEVRAATRAVLNAAHAAAVEARHD